MKQRQWRLFLCKKACQSHPQILFGDWVVSLSPFAPPFRTWCGHDGIVYENAENGHVRCSQARMMEVDDPAGEHENGVLPQIRDIHIFAVRTTARVRRAGLGLVLR